MATVNLILSLIGLIGLYIICFVRKNNCPLILGIVTMFFCSEYFMVTCIVCTINYQVIVNMISSVEYLLNISRSISIHCFFNFYQKEVLQRV